MAASVGYFIEYIMMHGTINIKLLEILTALLMKAEVLSDVNAVSGC